LCAATGLTVKKVATNLLWPRASLTGRVYETIDGILFNGFDKVVAVSELVKKEGMPSFFVPEGEELPAASRDSEGRLPGDYRLSTPVRR
jgi:hypothetical protein